jgi:hypothetical protein
MPLMMNKRQVMDYSGWTEWEILKLVKAGLLKRVHFIHDRHGKPRDHGKFSRVQVEMLATKGGGRCLARR